MDNYKNVGIRDRIRFSNVCAQLKSHRHRGPVGKLRLQEIRVVETNIEEGLVCRRRRIEKVLEEDLARAFHLDLLRASDVAKVHELYTCEGALTHS